MVSRPSRTTVEVRIGSFVDGSPRLQTYNLSSCKIAHMRDGAPDGQRPKLGRPAKAAGSSSKSPEPPTDKNVLSENPSPPKNKQNSASGKIQTTLDLESGRQVHPDYYIKKGPVITNEVFNKWTPDLLGIPSRNNPRPARSTRNQEPQYVHYLALPVCPA